MKLIRRGKRLGALALAGIVLGIGGVWLAGTLLVAPANCPVGAPPPELHAENVQFSSASGSTIHGWFVPGKSGEGAVVLMHGVHANRLALLTRAEWLSQEGYAVLLFDFQAHGESPGKQITFGYLESRDATAAVQFMHEQLPHEKVGVISISMGAAAALLANPPLPVDALVLESSYPTIYQATEDRLVARFGWLGKLATPLLTCQLKPRLGISLNDLKPVESVKNVSVPKFFISGAKDRNTTIEEAKSLFAAAPEPKQSWWVDGAGHQDMMSFAKGDYETRVSAFLATYLRQTPAVPSK